jgi:uncharacterized membrane protein YadS
VHSLHWLPAHFVTLAMQVDTCLLAAAMAALGLSTHVDAIRSAGAKPLPLALVLFGWLCVGSAFINHFVPALLAQTSTDSRPMH